MPDKVFEVSSCSFDINGGKNSTDIIIYDCSVQDVIDAVGQDRILDQIGKKAVVEYFNIQEKE